MPDAAVTVRPMTAADWPRVTQVYAAGIATGHATFEVAPPTWAAFDDGRLPDHRLVAVVDGEVVGWVAVSPVSARPVYAGVVEHSVFVDPVAHGRGIGRLLLDALVDSTEEAGVWTIQASIFAENVVSLALHEGAGFRAVGTRSRIGQMPHGPLAGQWRDTVLVERRSERVGNQRTPGAVPPA